MIKINGHVVVPTIFPDGTSQVWHLPNGCISKEHNRVEWWFESEAEVMHMMQLALLCSRFDPRNSLFVPYFPYARQDKEVSNDTSFALYAFMHFLREMGFYSIRAIDTHFEFPGELMPCENIRPIWVGGLATEYDTIIFPDKGAARRYSWIKHPRIIIGDKDRDQATGKILGYKLSDLPMGDTLVIDDLCDGGATFNILAESIKANSAPVTMLDLYVTHGIFSRGINVIREHYDTIYTTNSFFGHTVVSDALAQSLHDAAYNETTYKTKPPFYASMWKAYDAGRLIIEPLFA